MTDNEIIKALEEELRTALRINHRFMEACNTENPDDDRFITLLSDTLDLIKRKDAEIERLKNENFGLGVERDAAMECMDTAVIEAKSEAIREFAHQLKILLETKAKLYSLSDKSTALKTVDNLVKEMVGDE